MICSLCWAVHSLCPGGLPTPHSRSWSKLECGAQPNWSDLVRFFLSFVPSLPVSLSLLPFIDRFSCRWGQLQTLCSGLPPPPQGGAYRHAPHLASFLAWPLEAQLATQPLHFVFLRPFILCSAGRVLFYTFFVCLFQNFTLCLPHRHNDLACCLLRKYSRSKETSTNFRIVLSLSLLSSLFPSSLFLKF